MTKFKEKFHLKIKRLEEIEIKRFEETVVVILFVLIAPMLNSAKLLIILSISLLIIFLLIRAINKKN